MPAPLIADLEAREILDSRGNPTIEVDCILSDGTMGRASVPSGASTGKYEACETARRRPEALPGQGRAQGGRQREQRHPQAAGRHGRHQPVPDRPALIELDGTKDKHKLGANAILGTSLAVCRAASITAGICIYRFLGGAGTMVLPTPMLNVINGGAHASSNLDVQEYMIVPAGFPTFREALRAAAEIYQHLRLAARRPRASRRRSATRAGSRRRSRTTRNRLSLHREGDREGRVPAGRARVRRARRRAERAVPQGRLQLPLPQAPRRDDRRADRPVRPLGAASTPSSPSRTAWPRPTGKAGRS